MKIIDIIRGILRRILFGSRNIPNTEKHIGQTLRYIVLYTGLFSSVAAKHGSNCLLITVQHNNNAYK